MYPPIVPEYLVIRIRLKRIQTKGHDQYQVQIDDKRIYLNVSDEKIVVESWVKE